MTERNGTRSVALVPVATFRYSTYVYGTESGRAVIKFPHGAGSGSINSELRSGSGSLQPIYQGFEEI
jgi:hypothetical protein